MKKIHRYTLLIVVAAILSSASFYLGKISSGSDILKKTSECNKLADQKKVRYFGDQVGQYKVIWSTKTNTCLALNKYSDPVSKTFEVLVMDVLKDKSVLYYNVGEGETVDDNTGWNDVQMNQELEKLGF